jgi:hypothetical protein
MITQAIDWYYVHYNNGCEVYPVVVWHEDERGQVVGKITSKHAQQGGELLVDVPTEGKGTYKHYSQLDDYERKTLKGEV